MIILNVDTRIVGIVVDGVSDVLSLSNDEMRPTPGLGSVIDIEFIIGLGRIDDRMLILVDIAKLMNSVSMRLLEEC